MDKLSTTKGFVIDGYPRDVAQAKKFEEEVLPCSLIINLDVSDEVGAGRRKALFGKGRDDDSKEVIKNRLSNYYTHTEAVLTSYGNKVKKVDAEKSVDEVFADVKALVESL